MSYIAQILASGRLSQNQRRQLLRIANVKTSSRAHNPNTSARNPKLDAYKRHMMS